MSVQWDFRTALIKIVGKMKAKIFEIKILEECRLKRHSSRNINKLIKQSKI